MIQGLRIFFLLLPPLLSLGNGLDSLENTLKEIRKDGSVDTVDLDILSNHLEKIKYAQPDSAMKLAKQGHAIAKKLDNLKFQGCFWEYQGDIHWNKGQYGASLQKYEQAKQDYQTGGFYKKVISIYNNKGYVYMDMENYESALELYIKALKAADQRGWKELSIISKAYMARIYNKLKKYDKAIKAYKKTAQYYVANGKSFKNVIRSYNNVAEIYREIDNIDSALYYCQMAEDYFLENEINDSQLMAGIHGTYGVIYMSKKKYPTALKYLKSANEIYVQKQNFIKEVKTYEHLGKVYIKLKQYKKAENVLQKAKTKALKSKKLELQSSIYYTFSLLYSAQKKYKKAYEYQNKYAEMKDSIFSIDMIEKINSITQSYEWEKQQLKIDNLEKKEKLQEAKIEKGKEKNRRQTLQKYMFAGGLGLVLILSFFIFRSYRIKKNANRELDQKNQHISEQKERVEQQKAIVDEKNSEILDSITYAKRIQNAILPSEAMVKKNFPESFIFYQPKDIIAGDFYWLEENVPVKGSSDEKSTLIAVADCTGHGVPGAMVSVFCNNGLNRSVRQFGLSEPGAILDQTRSIVVEEFSKAGHDVNDGMDIALLNVRRNKQGIHLEYAGAHNSLWIISQQENEEKFIQKGAQVFHPENENVMALFEIKADKQPIGKFGAQKSFKTHQLDLDPGDSLYIFSDGYPDQFGGENINHRKKGGKKFKTKNFKKLLLSNCHNSMTGQEEILNNYFEMWKGNLEQLDDVSVLGIRV